MYHPCCDGVQCLEISPPAREDCLHAPTYTSATAQTAAIFLLLAANFALTASRLLMSGDLCGEIRAADENAARR
jgi:hypothetical protein